MILIIRRRSLTPPLCGVGVFQDGLDRVHKRAGLAGRNQQTVSPVLDHSVSSLQRSDIPDRRRDDRNALAHGLQYDHRRRLGAAGQAEHLDAGHESPGVVDFADQMHAIGQARATSQGLDSREVRFVARAADAHQRDVRPRLAQLHERLKQPKRVFFRADCADAQNDRAVKRRSA